ncbi:MAG: hypothetical protein GC157_01190 [Frankiales bacterium]|nr:hypothetical protein [Frankiales bacterium]
MVSYDLQRPGQNYSGLIEAIKGLGAYRHCLQSTWLVATAHSPAAVWDSLAGHVDKNDRVLVMTVGGTAAGWLNKADWDWINTHI